MNNRALKGRNVTAQGEALGQTRANMSEALKGRNTSTNMYSALSGLRLFVRPHTQGSALGYRSLALQAKRTRRDAFTLFEVILSVALAAVLLALISTAVNLYLTRIDSDRTRVEEAQLARSVLSLISDDIRGATVYQKQDTAAIAQLMAAGTPFDVDSIDKAREGGPGGAGGLEKLQAIASSSGASSASGASAAGTGADSASGSGSSEESDDTMPLGLSGGANELYVDVTRLPHQEELFATATGYTNAPSAAASGPSGSGSASGAAGAMPAADLKTVHYYVRSGNGVEAGSAAVTSLAPEAQASTGGLVRKELSRRMRVFAEQNGDTGAMTSGETLLAPEVAQIQFRYYDGTQLLDSWDMKELKKLPAAIEVCVWLRPSQIDAADYGTAAANGSHVYRQVVYLPMSMASEASAASAAESSTDTSTTDSSTDTSTDAAASGSGSAFGEQ